MSLVLTQTEAGVASIILNRPEEHNALNVELCAELCAAISAAATDRAIRCVVLRGAGGQFSAGGDLNMLLGLIDKPEATRRLVPRLLLNGLHQAVIGVRMMNKPVIAAIQGPVAGGALSLALACDFVVAEEETARLVYAYDALGISPDAGGSYVWPRLLGERAALELAFFGGNFGATDALAKGLINRVVPRASFDAEVASIARRLSQGPTMAYGKTKRLVYASHLNTLPEQLEAEAAEVSDCLVSDDFTDAVRAFIEKRSPKFEGR